MLSENHFPFYGRKASFFIFAFVILLFGIALYPERPAKLLTDSARWTFHGNEGGKVSLHDYPEQYRHVRRSVLESNGAILFRSWTPVDGNVPIELLSSPFSPSRYMSVVITGTNRTPGGLVQTYLMCEANGQRFEFFRGSVNVNVSEAIVTLPSDWCAGNARLIFKSNEKEVNVGVGSVYEISFLSYLKSGFIGRVPYFFVAFFVFSLVMLSGGAFATRVGLQNNLIPVAFVWFGLVSLGMFYLENIMLTIGIANSWRWLSFALMALLTTGVLLWSGEFARNRAARALYSYVKVWGGASFLYFTLLSLGTNGLGHWEPNYRFWPAVWSSDNELPWMFAEAIRHGWNLKGLFGGGWIPTDRPPLMAGAHLLLSDLFSLLQANNDGNYLRGQAYNAAAVVLNALWVPAVWWLLKTLGQGLSERGRMAVLLLIACIPFIVFNTVFGWPKAFGASFALLAFGQAWQSRNPGANVSSKSTIPLFFALGSFSMLAHSSTALFLVPLGLLFLFWNLRNSSRLVLLGFFIALLLLASWSFYKLAVLPSAEPVTKYALTGNYGFGHPDWSLWQMLTDRYRELTFGQWLEIKRIMLLEVFSPINHPVTQIGLNVDYGVGTIDGLRAWDFMLLSKGNFIIPFFGLVAAWIAFKAFELPHGDIGRDYSPFLVLAGISVIAWLLLVLCFLVPPVLHVWPQAAVIGLALGGGVVTQKRFPLLFRLGLICLLAYTGMVWILSPLQSALSIDAGAALVIALGASWFFVSRFLPVNLLSDNIRIESANHSSLRDIFLGLHTNTTIQRIGNAGAWTNAVYLLATVALIFFTYIAFRYIFQPLADVHAFRQTQTAISTFWMIKEGWSLAYQTPVAGFPWSIPFEFPLYQMLVASIVFLTNFDLEAVGRFISYVFVVACAWPAFAISKRLNLPVNVPWVFCALLWTSPLHVYWGRTFMIETTALFLTLACLPYGLDLLRRAGGRRSTLLFVAFATAAVLQKSTTVGPVLLFLLFAVSFVQLRQVGLSLQAVRGALYPAAVIGFPLVIGLAWAHYADVVKMANPFGSQLTSEALGQWNFGTMQQKLDPETWRLVVWERSLGWNAAGWLGAVLLLMPWLGAPEYRRYAWLSLASLLLFLLPVLIFTNLHFVHEYYQVACEVFLLGALAIVIGGWLPQVTGLRMIVPVLTLVIVLSNLMVFSKSYGIVTARTLEQLDPRSVQSFKVGRFLRDHTQQGTGLVVFGQGYSSEIAFQAQRKTMTVPSWFTEYRQLWEQPQKYLGNVPLSAIVICPPTKDFPTTDDLKFRLKNEPEWTYFSEDGCEMILKVGKVPTSK